MVGGQMLRAVDLFKHVPADFTQASKIGGFMSIVAIVSLGALLIFEVKSLLGYQINTRIAVSHREDDEFKVVLNFTFPGIACDWLSIDYLDVVGHKKENITEHTIHKYTLRGTYVSSAVKAYDQNEVKYEDVAPADYGDKVVVDLNPDNYDSIVKQSHVTVVNFFAPWCHHCVRLHPIYEQAARLASEKVPQHKDVTFASVDCTNRINQILCFEQHIQAFPTVRVYREGNDNPDGINGMHEEYRGDRSAEAISQFAIEAFDDLKQNDPRVRAEIAQRNNPDGQSDFASFGCVVAGYLKVSRVPGSIIFSPHAQHHNFFVEAINMSHVMTHLSFGPTEGQILPRKKKRRNAAIASSGAYAGADEQTFFLSLGPHITHEHYTKIVPRLYEPLYGEAAETYDYVINSNAFPAESDQVPSVRLVWDIWPMEVVETEVRKPLVEGICQLIGFLGGVFTFFMMFEGVINSAWHRMRKAGEGKLG